MNPKPCTHPCGSPQALVTLLCCPLPCREYVRHCSHVMNPKPRAAPCREYVRHCSHVMNVRFSPHNKWVVSVGGKDRSAMQWTVLREAQVGEVLVAGCVI